MKIFVTRNFFPEIFRGISNIYELDIWNDALPPSHDVLIEKAKSADGIICMLSDRMDEEVIKIGKQHKLKVISQMSVGFDNIAVKTATSLGIAIGNTPDVLTETTADFTWALMLALSRRVVESNHEVQNGIWRPWGPDVFCGSDIYGATLGLIGLGRIGKAVARRASGFNMRVLYSAPTEQKNLDSQLKAEYTTFNDLLLNSDFVSLHAYLSPSSIRMFGDAQFTQMKPGAMFINTARGAMVDHNALYDALISKHLAGAALDVFDPEPIPAGHPLLTLPNVIVTPHIGSATTQTRRRMTKMVIENIAAGLNGKKLPYSVNPEIYK
jgi:glyoxylate reductase